MRTAELRLGYQPDPTGYGSITASVTSVGFSGATGFAATDDELSPFLEALSQYPLSQPARLSIGEFEDGTLIGIAVSPIDGLGGLRVDVELHDDRDRNRFVSTALRTVYSDLEAFRADFATAIESGGEAVLKGEDFLP
jgi:hypothetical protein